MRPTTVPRFNWLAELARTVGFRDRKLARTVEFCKLKIPHKKSFVPLVASCVKTKRRNLQCMYPVGQVFTGASAFSMLRSYDRSYWMGVLSLGREEKYMGNCWEFMRVILKLHVCLFVCPFVCLSGQFPGIARTFFFFFLGFWVLFSVSVKLPRLCFFFFGFCFLCQLNCSDFFFFFLGFVFCVS